MQAQRTSIIWRLRRLGLAVAVLLGSLTALAGAGQASASPLIPAVNMGGGGGGGGAATLPAQYAGSANERSVALIESKEAPTVAIAQGSGSTRDDLFAPADDISYCSGCVLDGYA